MREILFRGFHECESGKQNVFVNGAWHKGMWMYGYTLIDNAECSLKAKGKCRCKHDGSNAWILSWEDDFHEYTEYEVIPSTVGQYTGLVDKNGKKIFEGDILQRRHKELLNHSQKMVIKYVPVKACFSAVDIGGGNITFISDYINNKYELEKIGNLHDNPELLEGDTE